MGWFDEVYETEVPYEGQATISTCWRACYRMLVGWKGKDRSIVDKLPNISKMLSRGILDSEFAACRDQLGLSSTRYTFFGTVSNVAHMVSTYGPIWVSGFYCNGSKHIVLVTGVNVDEKTIRVNDPWRSFTGAKGKPSWWGHGYFYKNINPVSFACQHWG